jgi:1-acyl-sn-glycerol-3-phosphate acyltransferase
MNPYFVFIIRNIGGVILWLMGFKVTGKLPPDLKKFVILGVPHTANRDFLMALGWLRYEGIRPMFVGKESLFYPPFGWFFKLLGGIPDNRYRKEKGEKTDSVIDVVVEAFAKNDIMAFGIAPEGTRKLAIRWKLGFYHIATRANVPIVLGKFDYGKKEVTVAGIFYPTGDIDADMRKIMSYYTDVVAHRPELFSLDERYVS